MITSNSFVAVAPVVVKALAMFKPVTTEVPAVRLAALSVTLKFMPFVIMAPEVAVEASVTARLSEFPVSAVVWL